MEPFRIIVVEDHQGFRRFICSALKQRTEFDVVGEVSDGFAAVREAERLKPDLILLDIGLPTISGIEAAKRIRKLVPQAKIVFVSQETSSNVVQECLRSGGLGYVQKLRAESDLLPAIIAALRGMEFVSQDVRVTKERL